MQDGLHLGENLGKKKKNCKKKWYKKHFKGKGFTDYDMLKENRWTHHTNNNQYLLSMYYMLW